MFKLIGCPTHKKTIFIAGKIYCQLGYFKLFMIDYRSRSHKRFMIGDQDLTKDPSTIANVVQHFTQFVPQEQLEDISIV